MPTLEIPQPALVVLIGISGAGKSSFAARHFAPTQVLSSDRFRAMLADDENDMSATPDAFEILQLVAAKRLRAGRLTVADATNVQPDARAGLLAIAGRFRVPAVAVVLDVPEPVCWDRTRERTDRRLPRQVLAGQYADLRGSLDRLDQEGFAQVHRLAGAEAIDAATVTVDRG